MSKKILMIGTPESFKTKEGIEAAINRTGSDTFSGKPIIVYDEPISNEEATAALHSLFERADVRNISKVSSALEAPMIIGENEDGEKIFEFTNGMRILESTWDAYLDREAKRLGKAPKTDGEGRTIYVRDPDLYRPDTGKLRKLRNPMRHLTPAKKRRK